MRPGDQRIRLEPCPGCGKGGQRWLAYCAGCERLMGEYIARGVEARRPRLYLVPQPGTEAASAQGWQSLLDDPGQDAAAPGAHDLRRAEMGAINTAYVGGWPFYAGFLALLMLGCWMGAR
jgi:hypothetical protein